MRERGQALADLESYRRACEREASLRTLAVDSVAVWNAPAAPVAPAAGPGMSGVSGAGTFGEGISGAGSPGEGASGAGMSRAGTPGATISGTAGSAAGGAWLNTGEGAALAPERKPPSDLKVLQEEDRRGRLFAPQGTILRVNLDPDHWLTAGLPDSLPVMIATENAFLSRRPVETAGRLAPAAALRLSGLLWPEARARLADSAYLTRESRGRGEIILFAGQPCFRGQFTGSMRLLENALLMGPGLGARNAPSW